MAKMGRRLDEITELAVAMARRPGGVTPAECAERLGVTAKAVGLRLARVAAGQSLVRSATKDRDAGYRYFGTRAEAEASLVEAAPAATGQASVLDPNDCRPWARIVAP